VENAASRISSFVAGLTTETYVTDDLHRSAVERQLLIVDEALNNLRRVDPETAGKIPDLVRIIGYAMFWRTAMRWSMTSSFGRQHRLGFRSC
jgi:hypothetical protein